MAHLAFELTNFALASDCPVSHLSWSLLAGATCAKTGDATKQSAPAAKAIPRRRPFMMYPSLSLDVLWWRGARTHAHALVRQMTISRLGCQRNGVNGQSARVEEKLASMVNGVRGFVSRRAHAHTLGSFDSWPIARSAMRRCLTRLHECCPDIAFLSR